MCVALLHFPVLDLALQAFVLVIAFGFSKYFPVNIVLYCIAHVSEIGPKVKKTIEELQGTSRNVQDIKTMMTEFDTMLNMTPTGTYYLALFAKL